MNKGLVSLIGFLIFFFGLISLILSLVHLKLGFLAFLDAGGRALGFGLKLLMIFVGLIVLYMSKMDRRVD